VACALIHLQSSDGSQDGIGARHCALQPSALGTRAVARPMPSLWL
jgi:hypothetical protein